MSSESEDIRQPEAGQTGDPSDALAETVTLVEQPSGAPTTPLADEKVREFSEQDADDLVGGRLCHFEVLSPLGAGGMGSVYRARDISLDRIVALKALPADFNEPTLIERFKREARAQARLSHPNVVPIYFIGEQDGRHFFAMELVEGDSLDAVLESRQRIPWPQALEHMIDVARATWLLGSIFAAVHPRKRTLHDLLTDTKVTYRLDKDA